MVGVPNLSFIFICLKNVFLALVVLIDKRGCFAISASSSVAFQELNPLAMTHRLKHRGAAVAVQQPFLSPPLCADRDRDKHPPVGWGPNLRHSAGRRDKGATASRLPIKGHRWVVTELMVRSKAVWNSSFTSYHPVKMYGYQSVTSSLLLYISQNQHRSCVIGMETFRWHLDVTLFPFRDVISVQKNFGNLWKYSVSYW